jgi:hypothetical protein
MRRLILTRQWAWLFGVLLVEVVDDFALIRVLSTFQRGDFVAFPICPWSALLAKLWLCKQ